MGHRVDGPQDETSVRIRRRAGRLGARGQTLGVAVAPRTARHSEKHATMVMTHYQGGLPEVEHLVHSFL